MALPLRNSRIKLSQGQIFWHEVGHGTTLVFLHGSWQDCSQWLPVIRSLSQHYHCLAPDLLGFGVSERPRIHYSVDLEVECLAEYLESLQLRQVYLVGHSLGAWIAASYALKYLDQVQGLILLEPEGVQIKGENHRWFQHWGLMSQSWLIWLLRLLRPLEKSLTKVLPRSLGIKESLQLHDQMLQSRTACKLLFQRRSAEIKAELLQERLQWLKIPLLVLQGEQDQSVQAAIAQIYAKLVPDAQLQLLPGVGQNLPETAPELIASAIQNFIVGTSSQKASQSLTK